MTDFKSHIRPELLVVLSHWMLTFIVKVVNFFVFITLSSIVSGWDKLIILLKNKNKDD